MDNEKAREFQEVAALLALQIELKGDILEDYGDEITTETAVRLLKDLVEYREKVITDKDFRESTYRQMCFLFNIPVNKVR